MPCPCRSQLTARGKTYALEYHSTKWPCTCIYKCNMQMVGGRPLPSCKQSKDDFKLRAPSVDVPCIQLQMYTFDSERPHSDCTSWSPAWDT
jgi:hypothetical protein